MTGRPNGILFRLRTPLASWSETGAALRPTDYVPTWSAIVGMMGAALGWGREDARLVSLATDYAMAVRMDQAGVRLEDYHTVQSPEKTQAEAMRARTRADELSVPQVHTTITRREYVSGSDCTVLVLSCAESPVVQPDQLAASLLRPVFPLYAGRRSCTLGRISAEAVAGDLDSLLPDATHWDNRLPTKKKASLLRERRDQRVGARQYTIRHECVA